MNTENLIGLKFGRLTVFRPARKKKNQTMWVCICDCGNKAVVAAGALKSANTKSCGCLNSEIVTLRNTKHSKSKTAEYRCWKSIKQRCHNENNPAYKNYGGRGIRVCDSWKNSFSNFLFDMGPKPNPKFDIDRIDNNLGYSPENCRWVDRKTNMKNTRNTHFVTFNGRTLSIMDWAEELNINPNTLYSRINIMKWDIEKVLSKKVNKK